MRFGWITLIVWVAAASAAQASFNISDRATVNVTCGAHACHATTQNANLNATELEGMLAAGNVKLTADVGAQDIRITNSAGYASASRLTLTSSRSIIFDAPFTVSGPGSVVLDLGAIETGGQLKFSGKGRLSFVDPGGSLTVDGDVYDLAFDIVGLAANIAADPNGFHALANDYDAAVDGVYAAAPVATDLQGVFEGLGNTIRRLKIRGTGAGQKIGLFADNSGSIVSLRLDRVSIAGAAASSVGGVAAACHIAIEDVSVSGRVSGGAGASVGGICGTLDGGFISASHTTGTIVGHGVGGAAGGLAGQVTAGHISVCYSTAIVRAERKWIAGGLVGQNAAMVENSFASGAVVVGDNGMAGGLIGDHNVGDVFFNYANGQVVGGVHSTVGGLLGHSNGQIGASYSSGAVASGSGNAVGGFVGNDTGVLTMQDDYWDIDTSGQSHGAGNDPGELGITGLTTAEFQAGLPEGFPPEVWAEDPAINNGLPYLLSNPPPR